MNFETAFPELLTRLHKLDEFDVAEGMKLEPYSQFLSPEKTQGWFRAWTGNPNVDGHQFRVFGQAPLRKRPTSEILAAANLAFPEFGKEIKNLCR